MEYQTPPQGAPVGANPQYGAQPQPGGFYQFQPGVGFVQVQPSPQPMGQQNDMGATQAMGQQADTGAAEASAQSGLFGQGTPEGNEPKFDQNKIGQMYGVIGDVMNGEADPAKVLGLFADTEGEFWKGALVGAAAVFLLNNETVKGAMTGAFGSMFGNGPDPEGEQVQVKPSK